MIYKRVIADEYRSKMFRASISLQIKSGHSIFILYEVDDFDNYFVTPNTFFSADDELPIYISYITDKKDEIEELNIEAILQEKLFVETVTRINRREKLLIKANANQRDRLLAELKLFKLILAAPLYRKKKIVAFIENF